MPLLERITRLFGDEGERESTTTGRGAVEETRDPSHVCRSCGKEYFEDPSMNIGTCRDCGGVKVEPV
jgi:ribosomal protein L37AE/L43A